MDPDAVGDGEWSRSMGVLLDGGRDRRRGRDSFGGEFGASHCNQLGLCNAALPKLLWAGLVFCLSVCLFRLQFPIEGICAQCNTYVDSVYVSARLYDGRMRFFCYSILLDLYSCSSTQQILYFLISRKLQPWEWAIYPCLGRLILPPYGTVK